MHIYNHCALSLLRLVLKGTIRHTRKDNAYCVCYIDVPFFCIIAIIYAWLAFAMQAPCI